MADQEETMRIVAEIVDKFSKPLREMRQEMKETTSRRADPRMQGSFEGAGRAVRELRNSIRGGLTTALAEVGVTTLSVAGAVAALKSAILGFAQSTVALSNLNRETGVSLNYLRQLEAVGGRVGVMPDTMRSSMSTFARNMHQLRAGTGNTLNTLFAEGDMNVRKFAASLRSVGSNEAAFKKILQFLDRIPDTINKQRFLEAFGLPAQFALMTGKERARAFREAAEDIGRTSKQAEEAAKRFDHSLWRLGNAWEGLKVEVGQSGALDAVRQVVTELRDFVRNDSAVIVDGINGIAGAVKGLGGVLIESLKGWHELKKLYSDLKQFGPPPAVVGPSRGPDKDKFDSELRNPLTDWGAWIDGITGVPKFLREPFNPFGLRDKLGLDKPQAEEAPTDKRSEATSQDGAAAFKDFKDWLREKWTGKVERPSGEAIPPWQQEQAIKDGSKEGATEGVIEGFRRMMLEMDQRKQSSTGGYVGSQVQKAAYYPGASGGTEPADGAPARPHRENAPIRIPPRQDRMPGDPSAFERGTKPLDLKPLPGGTGGGSEFLRNQRAGLRKQIESDPGLREELAGMMVLEGTPVETMESLANRTIATNEQRKQQGKEALSLRQMLHGGFYGPINRGQLPGAVARIRRDPKLRERMYGAIDKVIVGGSNKLRGATDQGMPSDPNGRWVGPDNFRLGADGKPFRGQSGNVFNDWGGGGGHEFNRQWRHRQQSGVLDAERSGQAWSGNAAPVPFAEWSRGSNVNAWERFNAAREAGLLGSDPRRDVERQRLEEQRRQSRERLMEGVVKTGLGGPQKVEGDATVRIDLNGFPRGTRTDYDASGLFKTIELNRGRVAPLASEET